MKKKPHKDISKTIKEMTKNMLVQILAGIIVALFTFWLNKTYGFDLGVR